MSARYLHYLKSKYQDNWSLTLAAYNWGETNVSRRINNMEIDPQYNYRELFRDIPETYDYIGKILNWWKKAWRIMPSQKRIAWEIIRSVRCCETRKESRSIPLLV